MNDVSANEKNMLAYSRMLDEVFIQSTMYKDVRID